MTTTVEAVERHLQTDVALVDALARDIARLRRTARWLIDEYDWEDRTEEAVVSALRRYVEDHPTPPLQRDRELLTDTDVDVRTGLATVTLPRTQATHMQIPEIFSGLETLDLVAVSPGRKRLRILVDADRAESVRESLPPGQIEAFQAPISAIQLRLPAEPEAVSLIGHATSALVHRGIRVLDVITCSPDVFILVPDEETVDAFEAVGRLTRQPDLCETETRRSPSQDVSEDGKN